MPEWLSRGVHPGILPTFLDAAEEALASFRGLPLETYDQALGFSVAGPARTRRKVNLKNPGRSQISTGINDPLT